MEIEVRAGSFDVTNPKKESTNVIRDFLHLRTNFNEQSAVQINDYFGSLLFCMIIGWKSIRKNPLVQSKLNRFQNRVVLDKKFTQLSDDIIDSIPGKINFHKDIIAKWRSQFTRAELEQVIDQNDDVNVDVGKYAELDQDGKEKLEIRYIKSLGSNCDAQIKVLIIQGVSKYQNSIFAVVCVTPERYRARKDGYESVRKSGRIQSQEERNVWLRDSKWSDGIRLIGEADDIEDESGQERDIRRGGLEEASDPEDERGKERQSKRRSQVEPIYDSNPLHGFDQNTGKYSVLDRNTKRSLYSHQQGQGKGSLIDIITFVLFICVALFVSLLIFHHVTHPHYDGALSFLSNTSQAAYNLLFSLIPSLKPSP